MMVFNEIDNFIEVYNNSVIELLSVLGPRSLVGLIKELGPKTLYSFNNL